MENKPKNNTIYVVILVLSVLVVVGVLAYSIYSDKQKERKLVETILKDGSLESNMQESLESMDSTGSEIQKEIDEKMKELEQGQAR